MKKEKFVYCVIVAGIVIGITIIFGAKCFSDDISNIPSGDSSTNIGAWYDESWETAAIYRLRKKTGTNEYYYTYDDGPSFSFSGASNFSEGPGEITESSDTDNSGGGGGHDHGLSKVKHITTGASIPQDIVITEWRCSGHVHFKSNM